MTEGMPPTPQEMRQLHRDLMDKVLDKACSDPQWKQQLLDDPQAAMRAANFPEAQQLEQILQKEAAEVRGQQRFDHVDLSEGVLWRPANPGGAGGLVCGVNAPFFTCWYTTGW